MIKFEKQISMGNVLTIIGLVGSVIWTASQVMYRFEALEDKTSVAFENSQENEEDVQSIQVRLATIETKLDEGFKSMEKLIKMNGRK